MVRLAILLVALVAFAGCGAAEDDASPLPAGETVELDVVEGAAGQVLAYVPVFIEGEGPYRFALDTGASQSLVSERIAEELGLERRGTGPVTGVVGATEAAQVGVTSWRVGDVELPAGTLFALDLGPDDDAHIRGLLGSDVLSTFDVITLDYSAGVLTLGTGD